MSVAAIFLIQGVKKLFYCGGGNRFIGTSPRISAELHEKFNQEKEKAYSLSTFALCNFHLAQLGAGGEIIHRAPLFLAQLCDARAHKLVYFSAPW